jgi:hypothetical protein
VDDADVGIGNATTAMLDEMTATTGGTTDETSSAMPVIHPSNSLHQALLRLGSIMSRA